MNLREADVENRSSVRDLFSWFDQEFGELDILIHAAGVNFANRSLRDLTEKEWDRLININVGTEIEVSDQIAEILEELGLD